MSQRAFCDAHVRGPVVSYNSTANWGTVCNGPALYRADGLNACATHLHHLAQRTINRERLREGERIEVTVLVGKETNNG